MQGDGQSTKAIDEESQRPHPEKFFDPYLIRHGTEQKQTDGSLLNVKGTVLPEKP